VAILHKKKVKSYKEYFGELMGLLFIEGMGQGADIECVKVYFNSDERYGRHKAESTDCQKNAFFYCNVLCLKGF